MLSRVVVVIQQQGYGHVTWLGRVCQVDAVNCRGIYGASFAHSFAPNAHLRWAFRISFFGLWTWCLIFDNLMQTNCSNSLDVSFPMRRMCRYPTGSISGSQSFVSVSPLTNEQMLVIVSSKPHWHEIWFFQPVTASVISLLSCSFLAASAAFW